MVAGWLCKGGGGSASRAFPALEQGGFQRGCREGFNGEEELFQRGGFARGVGVSPEGNNDSGGKKNKKIELDGLDGTVRFIRFGWNCPVHTVQTEPSGSYGSPIGPPV